MSLNKHQDCFIDILYYNKDGRALRVHIDNVINVSFSPKLRELFDKDMIEELKQMKYKYNTGNLIEDSRYDGVNDTVDEVIDMLQKRYIKNE